MILTTQNGPAVGVRGVTLRAVSDKRWRVLDRTGRVIGHLRAEAQSTASGSTPNASTWRRRDCATSARSGAPTRRSTA